MSAIKVLHVHNYYLQPGGEDTAFNAEVNLLRDHGSEVLEYVEDNHNITSRSQLNVTLQTVWSWDSYKKIKKILRHSTLK